MAKKTAAKKKTSKTKAAKKKPAAKSVRQSVRAMKGGTVVGGDIKAGRDVIMGDQVNYAARVTSPQEFVAELGKLRGQIVALKDQPELAPAHRQTIEVVEGQVQQVIEEAQKPQPLGARITATLTGAKAVMDSLSGSVTSAVGLGAALAGLGQVALKLFG
jgi:hypothetical protein